MENGLNIHIQINPDVRGGRPAIVDTRLTVADIVIMYLRLNQSLPEIAGKYDVSLAAVYAAMTYYYDHQREIDADIENDIVFANQYRQELAKVRENLTATLTYA